MVYLFILLVLLPNLCIAGWLVANLRVTSPNQAVVLLLIIFGVAVGHFMLTLHLAKIL
jgi:hypothetical protein